MTRANTLIRLLDTNYFVVKLLFQNISTSVFLLLGKSAAGVRLNQQQTKQLAKRKAHNRRIAGLIVIFMIFVICWLPLAVTFIFDIWQTLPGWLNVSLMACAWMNSSLNVYLYAYTNQMFKHSFKCILTCKIAEINRM